MKKVIHILHELLPSGAETMLKFSAPLWEGYEGTILATARDEGVYAEELRNAGFRVVHIHHRNPVIQHYATRRFLRRERFDVCHIHVEGQSVFYTIDARFAGVKSIVLTIHSVFIFHGVLRIRRIITRWISRLLGGKFVAITESVYENEIQRFHNPCVRTVYNWYDTDRFGYVSPEQRAKQRKLLGVTDDTFVVTIVGNCAPVKNHMMMLNAFVRFQKENDANAILWHIGEGNLEAEEKVAMADKTNRIVFWGRQKPEAYLQASDAYYMCSKIEGMSISAMEAMACGLPTVFADTVGLRDFKSLCSKELIYAELNEESMAKALNTLYQRFLKGILHSKELATAVRERYGAPQSVKAYKQIYSM